MKSFLKFFSYGIVFSGILLFLSFLLHYAPLDPEQGSIFSNGFATGFVLIAWGTQRIRSKTISKGNKTDIIYGMKSNDDHSKIRDHEKLTDSRIPSALGLFLAGTINLGLSFFL